MKLNLILSSTILLAFCSSCSWYRDLERSLVKDDEKKMQKRSSRPVSRQQYDQLLVKYEELSKKYEQLKENPSGQSLVDELQNTQGENFATSSNTDTETVNIFPSGSAVSPQLSADVETQLNLYRRGVELKASKPGEATKIFQQLEEQATPAIQVRAKFQVGELLYARQQFDLALQVFEDIITKQAHSGVVIEALKYAVVCTEKLGIKNKRDQYSSMLNDVFEVN